MANLLREHRFLINRAGGKAPLPVVSEDRKRRHALRSRVESAEAERALREAAGDVERPCIGCGRECKPDALFCFRCEREG